MEIEFERIEIGERVKDEIFEKLDLNDDDVLILMDTTIKNHKDKSDLECFSESVSFMGNADVLVMGKGWESARGCSLEHDIALAYDLPIVYDDGE